MIKDFLSKHGDYRDDKTFAGLTTVKMGGEIAHYVEPYNLADLKEIVEFVKTNHIPFKVLGNGSNLICGSSRFEGVVISLKHFDNYEINKEDNTVYVEAGILAPYLANKIANEGLSGFEFASGIPGTMGGLLYMNAGAYKSDMSNIVKEVLVFKDGDIVRMNNEELDYSYRHSIFQDHPRWIVIACYLQLEKGNPEEIKALMLDRLNRRKATQPLDKPSAGSSFRNPDNSPAWKLIDDLGLRGYKLNGCEVSSKHSNFIINAGKGKGEDYLDIAYMIQEKVKEKYGIKLIMEVEKFNC